MIKRTVSRDYKTDGDDIIALKAALNNLGFYAIPKHGITPYPDNALFHAIGDFQKSAGLPVTKSVRPGDATANALIKLGGKGPIIRCPECGGPDGGHLPPGNDTCPDCHGKGLGPGTDWGDDDDDADLKPL